ncbi:MAG: DUF885 domain-containing protein [candidate division WOR-3 bacterium]|nr:MAG: DUF885 domain-containing protein [candidate division WOR-3 bacterium]
MSRILINARPGGRKGSRKMTQKSICLLAFLALNTCAQTDQRPRDIEELFRNFVVQYVTLKPETGASLGLPKEWGIRLNNALLDDESDTTLHKIYEMYRKYKKWLTQFERSQLSRSQQIAVDVLTWFLDHEIDGERFRYHRYVISPLFSFHNSFLTLMTEHHTIETLKDAEDYIARLSNIDQKTEGILEQLRIRESRGLVPPIFIIENFQRALKDFVQIPYTDNLLFTSFRDRVDTLTITKASQKQTLYDKVIGVLKENVYPSYERIILYLDSIKDTVDGYDGVCRLPLGAEYYQYCLREHTTTEMTAEEIHNMGLQEVTRIQRELTLQFRKLGITASGEFADLLAKYQETAGDRANETYFFSPTEEGRKQTILTYQAIIDTMQRALHEMFSVLPHATVRVVRVPEYKEQNVGTYYRPPKLDGSEGGIFYANLSYQHNKSEMKALAYHEAIPGHHLQMAIEQEQSEARLFKALFFFTSYVEGWALYAEKLAGEYGFYGDTWSLIGHLRSELFRALRLVIDTGIHYKRWTRQQAYDYLMRNLGWSSYSEVDRYIMWPGQACAYKVGQLRILELRDRAKNALGDRFDIKEFHRTTLRYGSVPLAVLERLVNDYIESSNRMQ